MGGDRLAACHCRSPSFAIWMSRIPALESRSLACPNRVDARLGAGALDGSLVEDHAASSESLVTSVYSLGGSVGLVDEH